MLCGTPVVASDLPGVRSHSRPLAKVPRAARNTSPVGTEMASVVAIMGACIQSGIPLV